MKLYIVLNICSLALPCPIHNAVVLVTAAATAVAILLSKVFSFNDFLGGTGTGTGRDVTDGRTNIWTDRLFSENIILDLILESM